MNALEANARTDEARAVQNVASAGHSSAARQAADPNPISNRDDRPLLVRLQHSIRYVNDDTRRLQPRLGGSVLVNTSGRRHTIWLPATVWEGIASVIRQTPDHHRPNVAEFLRVLDGFFMPKDAAISALLEEIISELEDDPYQAIPESDRDDIEVCWS